jgi:hypothetical protein
MLAAWLCVPKVFRTGGGYGIFGIIGLKDGVGIAFTNNSC